MPEANWLDKELKSIKEDSKNWPAWMKPAVTEPARRSETPQSTNSAEQRSKGEEAPPSHRNGSNGKAS
jgi:hypothetical protein